MPETMNFQPVGAQLMNFREIRDMIERHLEEAKKNLNPAHYDCPYCRDTGFEEVIDEEGRGFASVCRCRKSKAAMARMKESGLQEALKDQTFDTFKTEDAVCRQMKETALRYVDALLHPGEGRKPWMLMCGNPGKGKTHICTAACGELLRNNKAVLYMKWTRDAQRLKSMMNDPALDEAIENYLTCDVLYIDDLMKDRGTQFDPSGADIRLAFMILNERYLRDLPTIISCEWDLATQLLPADEGLFSRVYERSKGFIVRIARDGKNNYRLKDLYRSDQGS